jgi:hypothetical protein
MISTGIVYDSLSGMVVPDDMRRWNWHEIECAWRQQGSGDFLYPLYLSIHWSTDPEVQKTPLGLLSGPFSAGMTLQAICQTWKDFCMIGPTQRISAPSRKLYNLTCSDGTDGGTFYASRETELYEGVRERSSLMLWRERFQTDLNCPLARLLVSAEIPAQKRENLLLNWFSGSQSRYAVNLLHTDLKTRSISRNVISLTHIAHKSLLLGRRMACRGA